MEAGSAGDWTGGRAGGRMDRGLGSAEVREAERGEYWVGQVIMSSSGKRTPEHVTIDKARRYGRE